MKEGRCTIQDPTQGYCERMMRNGWQPMRNDGNGTARASKQEFTQYLYIAFDSVSELEKQTIISKRLGYSDQEGELLHQTETARRPLLGSMKYLKKKAA